MILYYNNYSTKILNPKSQKVNLKSKFENRQSKIHLRD